jgi:flagellar protein FliS
MTVAQTASHLPASLKHSNNKQVFENHKALIDRKYKRSDIMNGIAAYQEAAIATQGKGRLIVLLYDGAIKFMKLAIKELEAGNYEAKGRYIGRAQDIINELNAVLDMNAGGEIAAGLRKLYCFMNGRLSEANTKCDPQMIREIITLMEELNQGWKAISG